MARQIWAKMDPVYCAAPLSSQRILGSLLHCTMLHSVTVRNIWSWCSSTWKGQRTCITTWILNSNFIHMVVIMLWWNGVRWTLKVCDALGVLTPVYHRQYWGFPCGPLSRPVYDLMLRSHNATRRKTGKLPVHVLLQAGYPTLLTLLSYHLCSLNSCFCCVTFDTICEHLSH